MSTRQEPGGIELATASPTRDSSGTRHTTIQVHAMGADEESKGAAKQLSERDAYTQRVLNLEEGFESLLRLLQANMPKLPPVHVEWENLSYTLALDSEDTSVPTLWTALTDSVAGLVSGKRKRVFHVLNNVSGHLEPGTTTLLLAPPGHGKSALLKALSGRISTEKLAGHVWYGGQEIDEVHASRLATYVDQADIHLPLLSVEETFQFASDAWGGKKRTGMNDVMLEMDRRRVEVLMRLLGLAHVKDTMVGDNLIRGVSGGEKKRVTFGEMACTSVRVMMMDEISTGLDSAATLDIIRLITQYNRAVSATGMISLLQPTPDVFALFDDVILMREGQIIYHGPQDKLVPYFEEMGLQFPSDQDVADFITEFISDPQLVYTRQVRRMATEGQSPSVVPPLSTDDLVLYYKASTRGKKWAIVNKPSSTRRRAASGVVEVLSPTAADEFKGEAQPSLASQMSRASLQTDGVELQVEGEYADVVYNHEYAKRPFSEQVAQVLKRQWTVQARNTGYLGPRIGQAVFMGLLLGVLFFDLGIDDFQMTFGLLLFAPVFLSFANISEVPIASADKLVVYKQTDARFYSPGAYVAGVMLTHIPLATVESIIFGTITYFMCGFASEFDRFATFLLLIWLVTLVVSTIFRLFAFLAPNEDAAQSMIGPTIGLFFLFGGFLITYEKIPEWLVWAYWSTPFSWVIKALAVNEFKSGDYDAIVGGQRLGDVYLNAFNVSPDTAWIWGTIIYMLAMYIIVGYLSSVVLAKVHYDARIGTSRTTSDDADSPALREARERRTRRAAVLRSQSMSAGGAGVQLAFQPMTVAFRDLHYSVPVKKDGQVVDKELLAGISGYATPGTLTALMGASGAGKSTLMDVICGRKSGGKITGDILINGHPKDNQSFSRVMGYVEQTDLIMPYATVRETLMFSAELRLDASVPPARRKAFVDSIIDLLELGAIVDRLVGDESSSTSISAGERKRLTIGVELVANPTVIFADEPTSGLDSKAAAGVMDALKRVAETGRTVVCTIHQPSAELFYMFDQLLLLQKGGKAVYFGSVENRAKDMVAYLQAIEGTQPLPPRTNPADWMLDVIGSGVDVNRTVDLVKFPTAYEASALHASNMAALAQHCVPKPGTEPLHFRHTYVRSIWAQLPIVMKRQLLGAWRNIGLNYMRVVTFIGLSLIFGLLFFQLDWTVDVAGVNSLNSFIFVAPLFNAVVFMNTAMPVMARERAVYYREKASRTYASFAYSSALLVAELPFCLLGVGLYQGISYWMVGLSSDFGTFLEYLLVATLLCLTCVTIGQFLVAVLPNKQAAQVVSGALISTFNLFGGFFVPKPSMSAGIVWLYYCSPLSYSFNAMASLQFHCEGEGCPEIVSVSSQGVSTVSVTDHMEATYDFDYGNRWTMVFVLVGWCVGFHILTALCLAYINHLKR